MHLADLQNTVESKKEEETISAQNISEEETQAENTTTENQ